MAEESHTTRNSQIRDIVEAEFEKAAGPVSELLLDSLATRIESGTSITVHLSRESECVEWLEIVCVPGAGEYALSIRRLTYVCTQGTERRDIPIFPDEPLWDFAERCVKNRLNVAPAITAARASVATGTPLESEHVSVLLERLQMLQERNIELRDNLRESWDD